MHHHQQQLQNEISRRQHALTRPDNTPALNQALTADLERMKRQLTALDTPNPNPEDQETNQDPDS